MKTQEYIAKLETEALNNWSGGNVPGYFVHAASDIIYFDDIGAQGGIVGIDKLLAYAESINSMIPKHNYEVVQRNVQLIGDHVAVHSFLYHPSSLEGEPQTKWKASNVYEKCEDTWKLLHSNWSMIKTN